MKALGVIALTQDSYKCIAWYYQEFTVPLPLIHYIRPVLIVCVVHNSCI